VAQLAPPGQANEISTPSISGTGSGQARRRPRRRVKIASLQQAWKSIIDCRRTQKIKALKE
jgi:hypothetical protein